MDKYEITVDTFNKLAGKYQEKYMDFDFYFETYNRPICVRSGVLADKAKRTATLILALVSTISYWPDPVIHIAENHVWRMAA